MKTSDATCSCMPLAFQRILVRKGIRSIIMVRDTLTRLAPMDVGAVYKGKGKGKKGKSKNKEKNKEKDPATNPDAGMICYYCHRKGHHKRDWRTFEKDKDKMGERSGTSAWIDTRSRCGALGDTITSEHDRAG